jgi:hypothetical protein
MPAQAKDPKRGKCVTCYGPTFTKTSEGVTGPTWCITTDSNMQQEQRRAWYMPPTCMLRIGAC